MRHVYLHVPFCRRRCSYCDFSIAVRKRIPAREYVAAVLQELALVRDSSDGALETLYLGGGTPSLLPPNALKTLLDRKSTRLNSSHGYISYAVFCLKKKKKKKPTFSSRETLK